MDREAAETAPVRRGGKPSRSLFVRVGGSLVGAALVLWIGYRILDPAPLSSATGIAFGLVGLWTHRRSRLRGLAIGLGVGLLAGVVGHWRVHVIGDSPHPNEGLLMHFAADAFRGSSVAVPALLLAWRITTWRTS